MDEIIETIKLDDSKDLPENYTGIVEYPNGSIYYYLNGIIHREDGPAIISSFDNRYYYLNGKLHREDGHAIIWYDGTVFYYINDNDITKEVNEWIKENNIPKDWNNSYKILFKLTFG